MIYSPAIRVKCIPMNTIAYVFAKIKTPMWTEDILSAN